MSRYLVAGCCVAVIAAVDVEAKSVKVDNFNANLFGRSGVQDLPELKNEFGRRVAIKVFQDSLKLHFDLLRNKKDAPELLKDTNWKYFLTINDVIPTEITKAMFDIEVNGDSVSYGA